jgi:hypothetical protein
MRRLRRRIDICLHPRHVARTLAIALVVGTWLTLFNHGDLVLSTGFDHGLAAKVLLNYATPFVVSNWGLLARADAGGGE